MPWQSVVLAAPGPGLFAALDSEWFSGGLGVLFLAVLAVLIPLGVVFVRSAIGPVLFFDLVRIGRQRRYFLLRFLTILGLTAVLFWVYFMWWMDKYFFRGGRGPSIQDMAQLAEFLFWTFLYVEFVLVTVLTPAYVAGAIADEKDRKTLEFILATDLRDREIVLSKLVARLLNMLMVILAAVPILSFTQFFGGIEPDLLLASIIALVVTTISLGCLGILNSVYTKKSRDAIVMTYLAAAVYLGTSLLAWVVVQNVLSPEVVDWPSTDEWASPVTLRELVNWLNAGNVLLAFYELALAWNRGQTLADVLPGVLGGYVLFHGLFSLFCCLWAIYRVRPVALKQTYGKAKKHSLGVRFWDRPTVTNWPMVWKEVFAEPGMRFNWLGRTIGIILLVICFVPAVWILTDFYLELFHPVVIGQPSLPVRNRWERWERLGEEMNIWVRCTSTTLASLMLLGVAVRAAGSVSGERDRQTLDALLASPLSCDSILFAKWAGSILSMRTGWLWLGLIWAIGIATGGLHVVAVVLLLVAWVVYAAFFAAVGLWFSAGSRTSLRATLWTLLATVGLSVGHWLLTVLLCFMPLAFVARGGSSAGDLAEFIAKFEAGQTPPFVLGLLAFQGAEFTTPYGSKDMWHLTASSVFGICCWGAAAFGTWDLASQRFRQVCGRDPDFPRGRQAAARLGPVFAELADAPPAPTSDGGSPPLRGALLVEEIGPDEDSSRPRRP
jgi:ABC-type transport system involved in multi-copper enzyme maturation permease subunit